MKNKNLNIEVLPYILWFFVVLVLFTICFTIITGFSSSVRKAEIANLESKVAMAEELGLSYAANAREQLEAAKR